MKKIKRYRKGDIVDVAPDDSGGGGGGAGVSQSGGNLSEPSMLDRYSQLRNEYPIASTLVDMTPLGSATAVGDAMVSAKKGDYGDAAQNLLYAIPGARPLRNLVAAGGIAKNLYNAATDYKKGGKIPTFKKGGSVKPASRGDGCAQRGKTKGRFV